MTYLYRWPDTDLMRRIKKLDPLARVWNTRLATTDVYLPALHTSPDLGEDRLMMITLMVSDLMVPEGQLLTMIDDWMTGSLAKRVLTRHRPEEFSPEQMENK